MSRYLLALLLLLASPALGQTVKYEAVSGSTVRYQATGGSVALGEFPPTLTAWFDATDSTTLTLSGADVTAWRSKIGALEVSQATAGSYPQFVAAGGAPLNGIAHLDFDGAADHLFLSGQIGTGSSGEVWCAVDIDVTTTAKVIYGQALAGSSSVYVLFNAACNTGQNGMSQRNTDTADGIEDSGSDYSVDTTYVLRWASSGTAWVIERNGAALGLTAWSGSNSGDWFSDVADDRSCIGAYRTGTASQWFNGQLTDVLIFDGQPTAAEVAQWEALLGSKLAVAFP